MNIWLPEGKSGNSKMKNRQSKVFELLFIVAHLDLFTISATSFTFKSLNIGMIGLPGSFNHFIYENTRNIKMINGCIRLLQKKKPPKKQRWM